MDVSGAWLTGGGLALAILGVAVGIYYGRRSRKFKQPVYFVRGNNLVQNLESKVDGVAITFKGNAVSTLTVSKLAFWNAGTETVDASDLSENDPLRLEMNDGEILETSVVAVTSPAVAFIVSDIDSGKARRVEFDFLDHQQGGVFQVIHTGLASKNLSLVGSVRGAGEPRRRGTGRWFFLLPVLAVLLGVPIVFGIVVSVVLGAMGMSSESAATISVFAGVGAMFGVMGLGAGLMNRLANWDVPRAIYEVTGLGSPQSKDG